MARLVALAAMAAMAPWVVPQAAVARVVIPEPMAMAAMAA
jgi:hypothetical protein